jgi:hypothetical protein
MMIEVTINRPVAVDDGKQKNIPLKIAVNPEHIRMIQPRLEGGSVVTFADGAGMIIAESKSEVLKQLRELNDVEPIERDRPESSKGSPEPSND